ncbi:hypothetical protein [Halobellus salinisoli]|uniref:hypothetical protein n=1 Tax=Halobellus salinisoli TaxID=3108500 RepID=UPI00300BB4A3
MTDPETPDRLPSRGSPSGESGEGPGSDGWRRRTLLRRALAGTVGILSLSGCGGQRDRDRSTDELASPPRGDVDPPATPVPPPFDSVTDLTDLGVDPTGGEPIGDVISDAASDGELLFLPSGEYPIEESLDLSGLDRFGIVGDGATIVPMEDASGTLFFVGGDGAIHIRNLQFDFTENNTDIRALDVRAPDDLRISDVTVNGQIEGGRGAVRVDVTDSDGSGVVERLRLPDGSVPEEQVTGCYVGDDNRGEITFSDCHIVGFGDNGLYADPAVGRIIVDGGYYANNGIANVRVRAGSVVRNVHVRCDDASKGFENMRGIRLTNSEPAADAEPPLVENCRVEMIDVSSSDGGITLSSELPSMTVRDTEIRIDADDVHGVWAKTPADSLRDATEKLWVDCEGVTVTGEADNEFAIKIDGRGGCTLSGIDVSHAATNRNGVGFQRSHDNVLRDATVDVGGAAIVLQEATLETIDTNVTPDEIRTLTEDE